MERRLTAILAADVVGYSRLMTIDEAGSRRTKIAAEKSGRP
jgi:class 3 adenylate cyclase